MLANPYLSLQIRGAYWAKGSNEAYLYKKQFSDTEPVLGVNEDRHLHPQHAPDPCFNNTTKTYRISSIGVGDDKNLPF